MPSVEASNWHVRYYWSRGSGLRLGVCEYQEEKVLHSAAVPFVYVNYYSASSGPFTDQLKSLGTDVEVREIMHGFDLKVTYDWYGPDYEYQHIWRFHDDGQFGSTVVIHGPGEEIYGAHTYHVPFRFDVDISGGGHNAFQRAGAAGWDDVEREGRFTPVAPPNFDWRVVHKRSGKAARVRARAHDAAEVWALAYKQQESWSAWGSGGAGVPGSPGSVPAIYDNDQEVTDTNVVLWYIAHIPAVERVSACGPWFDLQGFGPVIGGGGGNHPGHDGHPNPMGPHG
jgi:hypothetical protein